MTVVEEPRKINRNTMLFAWMSYGCSEVLYRSIASAASHVRRGV